MILLFFLPDSARRGCRHSCPVGLPDAPKLRDIWLSSYWGTKGPPSKWNRHRPDWTPLASALCPTPGHHRPSAPDFSGVGSASRRPATYSSLTSDGIPASRDEDQRARHRPLGRLATSKTAQCRDPYRLGPRRFDGFPKSPSSSTMHGQVASDLSSAVTSRNITETIFCPRRNHFHDSVCASS